MKETKELKGEKAETIAELDQLQQENKILQHKVDELEEIQAEVDNILPCDASFEQEVLKAWPNRHGSRYKEVKAFMVEWEFDDLGVQTEMSQLRQVLERSYSFISQRCLWAAKS